MVAMKFFSILAVFGAAAFAVAIPDDSPEIASGNSVKDCQNTGGVVSCCKNGDSLLGLNCLLNDVLASCGDQQTLACCEQGDTTASINVIGQCNQILDGVLRV